MPLDLLAFGAHPDDVEMSCGGLISKLSLSGYHVGICDFTRGEAGTRGSVEIRAREAEAARVILGAEVRENLALPDTGIARSERSHLAVVVEVLRKHRPRVVV